MLLAPCVCRLGERDGAAGDILGSQRMVARAAVQHHPREWPHVTTGSCCAANARSRPRVADKWVFCGSCSCGCGRVGGAVLGVAVVVVASILLVVKAVVGVVLVFVFVLLRMWQWLVLYLG